MNTSAVQIVDIGRGPQIAGHRLTVMDVFYYLHRNCDFEFIHDVMPSLTREQFDAVVEYVNDHRDELIEADRRVEARIQRDIADLKACGLYREIDDSKTPEERRQILRQKLERHLRLSREEFAETLAPQGRYR